MSTHEFQVGQKVRCVNLPTYASNLRAGVTYEIAAVDQGFLLLQGVTMTDDTDLEWFGTSRFEPLPEPVETPDEGPFEPGERVRVVGYRKGWETCGSLLPIGSEHTVDSLSQLLFGWSASRYPRAHLLVRVPAEAPKAEVHPTTSTDDDAAWEGFWEGDAVHQPHHYARLTPEPITVINAWGLGFNLGNAMKYLARHDAKGGLQDLKKAQRYLDIEIECQERKARVAAGESPADVWREAL